MNAIEHTEVRSITFVLSVCVSSGLCVRTYRVSSNACVQECVCELGRCARTNAAPCLCSNVKGARSNAECKVIFFFFLTKIFTK
jgi:hypothetical protein